ncbi:MAG: hypothetical protein U0R24_14155 [Solirubrobacterales bacterium]
MNRTTLEGYEQLGRVLVWAAGVVLVLGVVGAIIIAGSDDALPLFEDVERQGRGVAALASLAWGVAAGGVLAGLGAILRLLVTDRLERLGPAPEQERDRPAPDRSRDRAASEKSRDRAAAEPSREQARERLVASRRRPAPERLGRKAGGEDVDGVEDDEPERD